MSEIVIKKQSDQLNYYNCNKEAINLKRRRTNKQTEQIEIKHETESSRYIECIRGFLVPGEYYVSLDYWIDGLEAKRPIFFIVNSHDKGCVNASVVRISYCREKDTDIQHVVYIPCFDEIIKDIVISECDFPNIAPFDYNRTYFNDRINYSDLKQWRLDHEDDMYEVYKKNKKSRIEKELKP
jgi:hypothetical protein